MAEHVRSALEIAQSIERGEVTAVAVAEDALAKIAAENGRLGAFTDVLADRALVRALAIDRRRSAGERLPPLAGVPFAVKNLFDIAGVVTRAGSKINRSHPPAVRDATVVERLEAAGAILTGACTMDEYAYGFTGENAHEGPSRNPHDVTRMTGGSSGGPAAAVAGGLVPFAIGSDTNGSIRVPASLCGLYGFKPTYGRISRAGAFPFVASLDTVGPLARTLGDVVAVYDALQGSDPRDPICQPPADGAIGAAHEGGVGGLRIARAGDYFLKGAEPDALAALHAVAHGLGVASDVVLPEAHRARAAAFVMSAAEGGALHRERLKTRADDFDPDTRNRLIAGAMLPAAWAIQAQRFRRWFHREVMAVFETVDVILALATPITAPKLGQKTFVFDGVEMPVRAHLGIYTQPLTFIGLPVVTVPLKRNPGEMPLGVQVIAAPWNEVAALRVAREMGRRGLTAS